MTDQIQLSVKNVQLKFGGLVALDNVSFDVKKGEIFTLIGPNGAGKTTVFNLISRIYNPTRGHIEFEGANLTGMAPHQVAGMGIARTFQNIELFEQATVLQNLLIGGHVHRLTSMLSHMLFLPATRWHEVEAREQAEKVIDLLDLAHHRDSPVAGLPYGVRKVVEVARALCAQPRMILLDEPSSGLTVEETDDMVWWIKDINQELGVTVLMVEHDMGLVTRVSDRVLALNYGKVLATGTPAEVQSEPQVIEAYLGGTDDASSLRRTT
ncbi:ABC transporter ATP-binding protein [Sulfitobacter porphyrae]|nr:ABC transporter ATP-binding protein [Sulfitobacter porphyrae]